MARTISIPQQLYAVGTYTQTLDSFNPNTETINVALTRVAWPGVNSDNVARLSIEWSDGTSAAWELPGGVILDKFGAVRLTSDLSIAVPVVNTGNGNAKKNVVSGTVTLLVRQTLTTAITAEAA